MEPLGVEPRPTTILAADITGYGRLVNADEAGVLLASTESFHLKHAGGRIGSVVGFDGTQTAKTTHN